MKLATGLFDYHLPEELIAQYPAANRDDSRMLVLDRHTGECEIRRFTDIVNYLNPGDGIVFNNTRVMNARMYGIKNGTAGSAKVEIMLVSPADTARKKWKALIKPGKRTPPGTRVKLEPSDINQAPGDDWLSVLEHLDDGTFMIEFDSADIDGIQQQYGHIPLPPYIRRKDSPADLERYQTIFAKAPGAVAAPTAGLHFTPEIMDALRAKGVKQAELTLHVGPGTFKPVSVEDVAQHKMHHEDFLLPETTVAMINSVHASGHKILAVGTTTVRVLESCIDSGGALLPRAGSTDIFLYPPYQPKAADMLLTNFHLPKSTLLMLVSTFADREKVLAAYELAKKAKMRFYSYGDCMLLK
ncbi:MAG: tRNA preQ1(34) S-adenosylmethionine ribosyltransferase-isomerase QueA [Victivallaceae bacterium]|jgi:S-adenosylmethionine:tRNA ribosyltransferase-isomerase